MIKEKGPRSVVTVDDRRAILPRLNARTPEEAKVLPHEHFCQNLLMDRLGWPAGSIMPETVLKVAVEMTNRLVQRDAAEAKAKAAAEKVANATAD